MTELRIGNWRKALWLLSTLMIMFTGKLYAQEGMPELPGNPTTVEELEGRRLFVQRCAICHMPLTPNPRASYGPSLDGLYQRRTDDNVLQAITVGYSGMPGWQYTLTEEQVENVIAYLKTFKN